MAERGDEPDDDERTDASDDELDGDDERTDASDDTDDDGEDTGPAGPADIRIGTVDLPDRMDRGKYFAQMSYLELSALYGGPLKPSVLAKWADAPKGSIGLVAPFPLTHRKAPPATKPWDSDATSGEFRDSAPGRVALAALAGAVATVGAHCVVFRSPDLFAPSSANRDRLRAFFGEVATAEVLGVERVWIPDGLWTVRTAMKMANELGITCAFDPLVREPGEPPEIYEDLDVTRLYLRIEGLGRAGGMRAERFDDLSMLLEHYEGVPTTIAFASPQRWQDARNFKKLLSAN